MKSILDPTFRYTNAANTDIKKTFARIRKEQQREQKVKLCPDCFVALGVQQHRDGCIYEPVIVPFKKERA